MLSTSVVSSYPWFWGGFEPMVSPGIGVCYGAENEFVSFIISSFDEAPDTVAVTAPGQKRPRVTAHQIH